MTVDPLSVSDMEKLSIIKTAVSIANLGRDKKKYVKLHGRGPRVPFAALDGVSLNRYQQTLPLRHAERVDVYIYDKR
jgi:hypothetical protein